MSVNDALWVEIEADLERQLRTAGRRVVGGLPNVQSISSCMPLSLARVASDARLVLSAVDALPSLPTLRAHNSMTRRKDDEMKQFLAATAAMAFAMAAPVAAQQATAPGAADTAAVQPGTVVYGTDGTKVGTVAGQQDDVIVLKVGERMVPIARTAISQGASGPTIALTRAALVSEFDQRMAAYEAELDAAVKQGVQVQTADNQELGTIESVSGDAVAVQGNDGSMTLPKASLALDNQGKVTVRATMAQIREAMSAQSQSR